MDKIALITGGTKGIGRALADEFAKNGYSLILIARTQELLRLAQKELQEKYKCEVRILSADLEKRESVNLIMNTFKDEMQNIEVLVNNAGFGMAAKFTDMPMKVIDGMMTVNMNALVDLTYKVLPFMVAKKRGKILNLGSTASFTPGPYMAIYYATKAFVYSFSYALAEEYKKDGIIVSTLCPGPTESGFFERAGMQGIMLLNAIKPMTSEKVAEIGYKELMKNRQVIIPGMMNKMSAVTMAMTPRKLKTIITGRLNKPAK